jgi:hypothetical protein
MPGGRAQKGLGLGGSLRRVVDFAGASKTRIKRGREIAGEGVDG